VTALTPATVDIKWETGHLSSHTIGRKWLEGVDNGNPAPGRVDYAYAVTCYCAQGGSWDNVYIKLPAFMVQEFDETRWLYTAVTRTKARGQITLVMPS
jgi:hypothetical protein